MWLGDTPLDDPGKVIHIEEYLTRRERRRLNSDRKKGRHDPMNYLPLTFTKELKDFPLNAQLVEAGYEPNTAVLRTKLKGKEEFGIADLNQVQIPDPENPGKMKSAFTPQQILIKIAKLLLVKWSFKNFETGEVYEINEDNILELFQDDFDYLVGEVNGVLTSLNPENRKVEDGEPKSAITEDEKKESSDGSTTESEQSGN